MPTLRPSSRPPNVAGGAADADRHGTRLHPLPAGMRDSLPDEARRQSSLATSAMHTFELFGYERVAVPAFEYADVLERGLGTLDPEEVLRFVEPETGEVVALRPDMTPQLARLIATRLREAPPPARLCYEGSVLRRRRQRARRHRQIPQTGIELVGREGPAGDLEVLSVVSAAVRAAGLTDFAIDLGHARIAGALLEGVAPVHREGLVEALGLKDATELARRASNAGLGARELDALGMLPDLHGSGSGLFERAERVLSGTLAQKPLGELRRLVDAVEDASLAPRVVVDLGETRAFAYYTGMIFQLLAEGPGEPVAAGGRYDSLLERFGLPRPAAGFAIDLDNLGWALGPRGAAGRFPRLLVSARGSEDALLAALRREGVRCAPSPSLKPLEYAKQWRFTHLLELDGDAALLVDVASGDREELPRREILVRLLAALLENRRVADGSTSP